MRRSQTGTGNSGTKYTITAFGLEDHIYDGGGTNLNNKYYYSLAGHLVGLNNGSILFLFTDALGSVVASISNTANSALVKGNQVYGPYGNNPYSKGTMGTTRVYTGQYNDALTQLDYYKARYYDPLVGIFLSADSKEGNTAGMDPYMYVGGNPETDNDPTGQYYGPPSPGNGGPPPTCEQVDNDCWSSSGGSGHPPTNGNGSGGGNPLQAHRNIVNLGGCNPSIDQSIACKAWAWDASNVRSKRLDGLYHNGYLEMLAGYILFLTGDIISFINSHDLLEK